MNKHLLNETLILFSENNFLPVSKLLQDCSTFSFDIFNFKVHFGTFVFKEDFENFNLVEMLQCQIASFKNLKL